MARKVLTSDQKPGPLPEIKSAGDSITFVVPLDDVEPGARMRLRCDAKGNIWVSVTPEISLVK